MAENNYVYEFAYSDLPLIKISVLGVALNVLLLLAFLKDPQKCFRNSGTYLVMNTVKTDWLKQPIFIGCNQFLIGHFSQLHNWSLRNDQLKLVTSTN